MSPNELVVRYQQRVTQALERRLPAADIQPMRLHQAMRYAALNGGKRVRPVLAYLTGTALEVAPEALDGVACGVELIHAYSLIHDDLPAMDDDDLRRGLPACHKAFDEATAILAGDALQSLAFQVLSNSTSVPFVEAGRRVEMINTLAAASGSRGMAGGQAIDIDSAGLQLNLAELENMHIHKTGALIRASVKLGALCSLEIEDASLQKLEHYAKCIGLAFQIQDDILDVESTTETLGKISGADRAMEKPTYPALLGLQGAKQMANELVEQAVASLDSFDQKAEPLRWMARYIVTRKN